MSDFIDFNQFEGGVVIAADHRRGIWAAEMLLRGMRTIRTGGQLSTEAAKHTLLTVALLTTLRDVTKRRVAELLTQREWLAEKTGVTIAKPRIRVVCADETFCDALSARMKGQRGEPTFRAGKNFLKELARQVARFDLSLVTDQSSIAAMALRNWAQRTVHDPKAIEKLDAALTASATAQVI